MKEIAIKGIESGGSMPSPPSSPIVAINSNPVSPESTQKISNPPTPHHDVIRNPSPSPNTGVKKKNFFLLG